MWWNEHILDVLNTSILFFSSLLGIIKWFVDSRPYLYVTGLDIESVEQIKMHPGNNETNLYDVHMSSLRGISIINIGKEIAKDVKIHLFIGRHGWGKERHSLIVKNRLLKWLVDIRFIRALIHKINIPIIFVGKMSWYIDDFTFWSYEDSFDLDIAGIGKTTNPIKYQFQKNNGHNLYNYPNTPDVFDFGVRLEYRYFFMKFNSPIYTENQIDKNILGFKVLKRRLFRTR